jgi:cell division septation protein DedD
VLAVGVGAGFAIGALTNDKQKKDAKQASAKTTPTVPAATAVPPAALTPPPTPVTPSGPSGPSGPTGPASTPPPTTPVPPATATPPPTTPSPSGIASWPAGRTAYTVVLVSAKRHSQANAKAREAKSQGIDAGVLHSNDYSSLNPGYWVVFAGQYNTANEASSHVDEFASKGFPGGYPRQIKK